MYVSNLYLSPTPDGRRHLCLSKLLFLPSDWDAEISTGHSKGHTILLRFWYGLFCCCSCFYLCLAVRNNSSLRGGRERSCVEKPFFPSFPFYCGTLLSYEAREGRGDMGSVQWAGPSHRRSCVPEFPGLLRGPPPSPMTERRALPFSSLFTHDVGCVGAV